MTAALPLSPLLLLLLRYCCDDETPHSQYITLEFKYFINFHCCVSAPSLSLSGLFSLLLRRRWHIVLFIRSVRLCRVVAALQCWLARCTVARKKTHQHSGRQNTHPPPPSTPSLRQCRSFTLFSYCLISFRLMLSNRKNKVSDGATESTEKSNFKAYRQLSRNGARKRDREWGRSIVATAPEWPVQRVYLFSRHVFLYHFQTPDNLHSASIPTIFRLFICQPAETYFSPFNCLCCFLSPFQLIDSPLLHVWVQFFLFLALFPAFLPPRFKWLFDASNRSWFASLMMSRTFSRCRGVVRRSCRSIANEITADHGQKKRTDCGKNRI